MKEIRTIKINPDSDFWKATKRQDDPEAAAVLAAERARKEVEERNAKREAERKAYLGAIRYHDFLQFKTQELRDQIMECEERRDNLRLQQSQEWEKQSALLQKVQNLCLHEMCLEKRTSYTDEYGGWHDGHYERKCIECFLVEESDRLVTDNYYEKSRKKYNKLEKAVVVMLRKVVDDKEFELEFDDLKW
jgi:hypothetical protein